MKRSPDMAKAFWNTEISVSVNDTKTKLLQTVRAPRTVTIKPRPEDIPTFGDFLEFVLSTNLLGSGFSSHWVPYWRACTPCHFKYSGLPRYDVCLMAGCKPWCQCNAVSIHQVSSSHLTPP